MPHKLPHSMESLLRQMGIWYRTPLGTCLLETEQAALAPYLSERYNQYVLQLGGPDFSLCPPNPYLHPVRLSPERRSHFKGASIRASFEAFPFLPESLDTILFPHVLELTPNPHILLDQSEELLAPDGRLIILGFNPFSLWGLYKSISLSNAMPRCISFKPAFFIRHQLKQRGFVIESDTSLFFRPPFKRTQKLDQWMIMEPLGRLLWPDNGAVYLIVAKKQVAPLMPIRETLRTAAGRVRYHVRPSNAMEP